MPSCSRATVMPRTLLLWASILVLLARMAAGISPEDVMAPVGSPEKLAWMQRLFKDGADPMDIIQAMVKGTAFQKLYDNVEMQHRLLEAHPLLGTLPGFSQAKGRRLSDQETSASFRQGVDSLMKLGTTTSTTVKDPSAAVKVMDRLARTGDQDTKSLLQQAKGGDADAIQSLRKLVAADLFPGVDVDALDEAYNTATFDKILETPEMMHFIDQDRHLSEIFRTGAVLPSQQLEQQQQQQQQQEAAAKAKDAAP